MKKQEMIIHYEVEAAKVKGEIRAIKTAHLNKKLSRETWLTEMRQKANELREIEERKQHLHVEIWREERDWLDKQLLLF